MKLNLKRIEDEAPEDCQICLVYDRVMEECAVCQYEFDFEEISKEEYEKSYSVCN